MKVIFLRYLVPSSEVKMFTLNKVYDAIDYSSNEQIFWVIDDLGDRNYIPKSEGMELSEYKNKLIQERYANND